nr:MAG TPA: hypothetical protein [Caudoviricetes sp.]
MVVLFFIAYNTKKARCLFIYNKFNYYLNLITLLENKKRGV